MQVPNFKFYLNTTSDTVLNANVSIMLSIMKVCVSQVKGP